MTTGYSVSQKALHWAAVVLFALQWWTSRAVLRTHQPHLLGHSVDPSDPLLHKPHIYGGIAMLALVACRLMLRMRRCVPPLPLTVPHWAAATARWTHVTMYAMLIGLTATGLITPYVWFGMGIAHRALVYGLYLLIGAHILAVIWHDAFRRVGILRRMTR